MKIPILDLKVQYESIKDEIDSAVARVIKSQNFILSQEVDLLEDEISGYIGVKYAAGVASGTDALYIALRALDIGKGDSVITTPFTFFATCGAISIVGANPIFVDIEPDTYNIDPDKIEKLLRTTDPEKRAAIKAIIPVHLYGQCAQMDKIMKIANKHGLKVIEDAAQSIGAGLNGKQAANWGDVGILSFFPSKNLGGFGDGGMIVSNNKEIIDRVKRLRVHGSSDQYVHDEIGYNSRLDSIQAAVVRVKLKKLDKWIEERRKIASQYNSAFKSLGIKIPLLADKKRHTFHQYTIGVEKRDNFIKRLILNGIAARVYYPIPMHLQACYKELGYKKGDFPISEEASRKVISLPVYPELTSEEREYIIKNVREIAKNRDSDRF